MSRASLAAVALGMAVAISLSAQTALAACGGSVLVVLPAEEINFITLSIGEEHRVVRICQGGVPPTVWYDVYWCQCNEGGSNCGMKKGTASEPGNPPSSEGCTLIGGSPPYSCRIASSGSCTP